MPKLRPSKAGESMRTGEDEGAWWQSPVVLGWIVLILTAALYLMFA